MPIALTLGPLGDDTLEIRRSQPRWLAPDGSELRAGEAFAFFNLVAATKIGGAFHDPWPEERTIQVAVASPRAGRIRHALRSGGGMRDALSSQVWSEAEIVAEIDGDGQASEQARLLFLAGERQGWANETDAVLLPGWNTRARAWWEGDGPARSLLCLGLCEASSLVRGAQGGFLELFARAPFPAHVAHVSEHPLVPCSPMLIDQFAQAPAVADALARDLTESFAQGPAPTSSDWIFAGALLRQLCASPFRETPLRLTRLGFAPTPPPAHALLSLASEPFRLLRHRVLGRRLHILRHDVRAAGPALRHWLKTRFEPVERSVADIAADYRRLAALAGETGARLLVLNRVSSSPSESILNYSGFTPPLSQSLAFVAAKELNLVLEDLAARGELGLIDVDAAAADLGIAEHAPDAIHFSEALNDLLRDQLLAAMR